MSRQRTIEKPWQRWLIRLGVLVAMVILCVPGVWVVLTAFRPNIEILARPAVWIPKELTLNNFKGIFGLLDTQQGLPVAQYFINSIVISVTSTVVAIVIGMAGGYAFARYRFKGKGALFLAFMLSRTVPGVALSLPLFILWARVGLIDTPFGLILVYMAVNIPFTIWLTDGFFRQIPVDLSEAAQIDGCTRWQAFWKVEFPLARSGLASAAIFAFLTSWNEYALASQLTRTTASKTMPVGLMDFTAQFTVDWTGMSAMAVLIIIPALVLTFIVQKHLIAGLTFGGVKG
ncbi:maltose ABC transporter permease [Youhaiella tibetensis]|uniref:Maltose/maltodextrin transport system permease protein MalG n=1 Tax=Paradevosia tibetensis TaxID=1447062 RepID=A0A5B9DT42_9HYPH|nr:carbohydrate ABC transporter permease [Youhaiella tibetensis]QEE22222.1 carbohydrate ABC transporter permease [Youhaiella tibetensis]GGF44182.1 maltose ABC transporter permease [Youhaiella tibetensis]